MENLPFIDKPSFDDNNLPKHNFLFKKVMFYVVGFIAAIFFVYFFFFTSPTNFPVGMVVNIKEDSSLRSISKSLEENKIIRSRVVFETFVIIFGGEKHIALGDYLFEKRIPVFEVARRISKGEKHLAPIKVTIPEGFNIADMALAFSSKLQNFNKENFLAKAKSKEGYLFPDTYFFFTADNEDNAIQSMSDNFYKKITPIISQINSSGKSEKAIITMASIIEKESKGDSDRDIVSGILWHRIAIGMPLQVDAEPSTYKTKGLPPAPIANPGMAAIKAAIFPKVSNYLYYLHDKEGNIHFALTFEEHKLNKRKYLKN